MKSLGLTATRTSGWPWSQAASWGVRWICHDYSTADCLRS